MWKSASFTERRRRRFEKGYQLEVLLKRNVVTGATMAFRSEIKNFILPISELWIHDGWIALIGSALGRMGVFINEPLIYYRQHSNQAIGGRKVGLYKEVKNANSIGVGIFNLEQLRFIQIIERLITLNIPKNSDVIKGVSQKVSHIHARANLHTRGRIARMPLVLKELIALRYHRFSGGWKSVARDIFL
jgi:hypothetical protein